MYVPFGGVMFTSIYVILDSLHWNLCIWVSRLFQNLQVHIGKESFHWSAQFECLDMSAGNILGEVVLAIKVYFWVRSLPSPEVQNEGATGWKQLDKTAGLILCPSEAIEWALQLSRFFGQAY